MVFDAADLAAESSFWAGVLGGTVDAEDDWHMVLVDGEPRIGVQLAPNYTPPDWPDGAPQQIHLDLWVEDPSTAHDLVMSLGATGAEAGRGRSDARRLPGLRGPRRPSVLPVLGQLGLLN